MQPLKPRISFQPSHATVTVNPDGKTVNFQLKPGTNRAELSTEIFGYSVGLVPSPGQQPLTANTSGFVMFSYLHNNYSNSECKDGRKIGPVPTVTDGR